MNDWLYVLSNGHSQIPFLRIAYACFQINLLVIFYIHLTV